MPTANREESAVDWNAIFEVLGNEDRRRLLANLLEHDPQEAAVQVPESVHTGEKELATLQTEFVHRHLPKLDDLDYIRWVREDHQVVKGPRFDEIRPLLTLIEDHQEELPDGWV